MSRPSDWDPLAESDPVPGDPYSVRRLAAELNDTAQAIKTAVATLNTIHDSDTVWEGEAATAFRSKTRETADTIAKAQKRYEEAAGALSTYATSLEDVQDDADSLLTRATQAKGDVDDAQRAADHAEPDQQSGKDQAVSDAEDVVAGLRSQLDPIVDRWNSAGNTARDAIEDVIGTDDLEDGMWDNVAGALKGIASVMGAISAFLGVLAAICAVIPFLQPFAAVLGALALITGLISLLANTALLVGGKGSLSDVLWDVVGVVSFGAGRAFTMAGRSMVKAARGASKPAFIRSLRAGGQSARGAKRLARRQGVTGGGREAKSLARDFEQGNLSAMPRGSDWKAGFTSNPFRSIDPIKFADFNLPAGIKSLEPVSTALRHSQFAAGGAHAAGAAGNVADIKGITELSPSPIAN